MKGDLVRLDKHIKGTVAAPLELNILAFRAGPIKRR